MRALLLLLLVASCDNDCSGFAVVDSVERREGVSDAGQDLEVL